MDQVLWNAKRLRDGVRTHSRTVVIPSLYQTSTQAVDQTRFDTTNTFEETPKE